MKKQREIIYKQRNQVLDGDDIKGKIRNMVAETIKEDVSRYITDDVVHDNWDLKGLREYYLGWVLTGDDLIFSVEEL